MIGSHLRARKLFAYEMATYEVTGNFAHREMGLASAIKIMKVEKQN